MSRPPNDGADAVSLLDKPKEERQKAPKATNAGPTEAETLDNTLEDLRNSTITTYAANLDSPGAKNVVMLFARYPVFQLAVFLAGVTLLSIFIGFI